MSPHPGPETNQTQAITRTMLQRADVPGTNYETVFGIAEIAPNADFSCHTHPGTGSGYLLEGSIVHIVKGQLTREAKAGDSVLIPAGVPHSGRAGPDTACPFGGARRRTRQGITVPAMAAPTLRAARIGRARA